MVILGGGGDVSCGWREEEEDDNDENRAQVWTLFGLRTFLFDKIQMLEGIRESKCICLVFLALNVPPAFADRQRHLQRAQVSVHLCLTFQFWFLKKPIYLVDFVLIELVPCNILIFSVQNKCPVYDLIYSNYCDFILALEVRTKSFQKIKPYIYSFL